MVERTKAETFEEFVGTVDSIHVEPSSREDIEGEQYHITITPHDVKVEGKTGKMHEWIKISAKATDKSIPEGSALDRFVAEVEAVMPETKKAEFHSEVMTALVGKKFKWIKKKLGKSFGGFDAKDYWIPQSLIKE